MHSFNIFNNDDYFKFVFGVMMGGKHNMYIESAPRSLK